MNTMQKPNLTIGGHKCMICAAEKPIYLLVQPVDEHDLSLLEREVEHIRQNTSVPFVLTAFRVRDWNAELSPWAASVRCALEWNPGNHFKDTDIRTAKGFLWAMEHS